jgi:hypothetical protein
MANVREAPPGVSSGMRISISRSPVIGPGESVKVNDGSRFVLVGVTLVPSMVLSEQLVPIKHPSSGSGIMSALREAIRKPTIFPA